MVLATGGDRQDFGGRLAGARSSFAWHNILAEMGMVRDLQHAECRTHREYIFNEAAEPIGEAGAALERAFGRFADDLAWWTEAASATATQGASLLNG